MYAMHVARATRICLACVPIDCFCVSFWFIVVVVLKVVWFPYELMAKNTKYIHLLSRLHVRWRALATTWRKSLGGLWKGYELFRLASVFLFCFLRSIRHMMAIVIPCRRAASPRTACMYAIHALCPPDPLCLGHWLCVCVCECVCVRLLRVDAGRCQRGRQAIKGQIWHSREAAHTNCQMARNGVRARRCLWPDRFVCEIFRVFRCGTQDERWLVVVWDGGCFWGIPQLIC